MIGRCFAKATFSFNLKRPILGMCSIGIHQSICILTEISLPFQANFSTIVKATRKDIETSHPTKTILIHIDTFPSFCERLYPVSYLANDLFPICQSWIPQKYLVPPKNHRTAIYHDFAVIFPQNSTFSASCYGKNPWPSPQPSAQASNSERYECVAPANVFPAVRNRQAGAELQRALVG